jgi:hypothetical protein
MCNVAAKVGITSAFGEEPIEHVAVRSTGLLTQSQPGLRHRRCLTRCPTHDIAVSAFNLSG